jgi:anti-sigma B factor antagonist
MKRASSTPEQRSVSRARETSALSGFYVGDEQIDDRTHVLKLGGEVDLHAAPEVRTRLDQMIEAGARAIVLDMTDATFIDSSALGAFVHARKRLGSAGRLAVACENEQVLRIFEYAGLEQILPAHPGREAALAALR